MFKHAPLWPSIPLILLTGCSSAPPPTPATGSPPRLPFPSYVVNRSPEWLGGAAWRGGQPEHALAVDGQSCGVALDGRVHCRRQVAASVSRTDTVPSTGHPLADRPGSD